MKPMPVLLVSLLASLASITGSSAQVNLQSTPVTNTTTFPLSLRNMGVAVANLASGGAAVLTLTFDEIWIVLPTNVRMLDQNPPAPIAVNPGNLGLFATAGNDISFTYAMPNQPQNQVFFTAPPT
jgi:hypothetical protein